MIKRINKGVGHETAISTYSNTYKEYQHEYLYRRRTMAY